MSQPRVTIAGSMGLVALAAILMAALRYPCEFAVSAVYTLVVLVLLAAGVLAISQPGRRRAAWSSFVLCGGVYFFLSLNCLGSAREYLPDTISRPLTEMAYEKAVGRHREGLLSVPSPEAFWFESSGWKATHRAPREIPIIVQSFLSLAVATVGGLFSLWLTKGAAASRPSAPPVA